jgi:hypothetical protein
MEKSRKGSKKTINGGVVLQDSPHIRYILRLSQVDILIMALQTFLEGVLQA